MGMSDVQRKSKLVLCLEQVTTLVLSHPFVKASLQHTLLAPAAVLLSSTSIVGPLLLSLVHVFCHWQQFCYIFISSFGLDEGELQEGRKVSMDTEGRNEKYNKK